MYSWGGQNFSCIRRTKFLASSSNRLNINGWRRKPTVLPIKCCFPRTTTTTSTAFSPISSRNHSPAVHRRQWRHHRSGTLGHQQKHLHQGTRRSNQLNYSQKAIWNMANTTLSNSSGPKPKPFRLLVHGGPGTGKSFLAVCIQEAATALKFHTGMLLHWHSSQ